MACPICTLILVIARWAESPDHPFYAVFRSRESADAWMDDMRRHGWFAEAVDIPLYGELTDPNLIYRIHDADTRSD